MILKSSALPSTHSVPGSRPRGRPPNALKYAHLLEDRSVNWADGLSRGLLHQQQLLLLQQQKQLQFYQDQNEQLQQQMQMKGQQQQLQQQMQMKELQQMKDRQQQQHLIDQLQQQSVDLMGRDQQYTAEKQRIKDHQAQQLLHPQGKELERFQSKEQFQSKEHHRHQQIRDQIQQHLHRPEQQLQPQQKSEQHEHPKEPMSVMSRNEKHQISFKKESKKLVKEKLQREDTYHLNTSIKLQQEGQQQQEERQQQQQYEQQEQDERQSRRHELQPQIQQELQPLQQEPPRQQQERQSQQQERPHAEHQEQPPLRQKQERPLPDQPLQLGRLQQDLELPLQVPQEQQKQIEHQKEQKLQETPPNPKELLFQPQQQQKREEQQLASIQPQGQSLPQSISNSQQKLHYTPKDHKQNQAFMDQQILRRKDLHKKSPHLLKQNQDVTYLKQKQDQHPLFKESSDHQDHLKQLPHSSPEKAQHYHSLQKHPHLQQKQASVLLPQQQTLKQSPPKISQKCQSAVPDFSSLSTLLSDPNLLSNMKGKVFPGVDPQLVFELYKAQLTQSTFQTEFIRQLAAHNLSLPQITPNLFSSLPNLPFGNNSVTGSNYKVDSDHSSSQASNVMSDYVKDRPSISITPINQSNSSNKQKPAMVSSSSSSMNANYTTTSQEKTRPTSFTTSAVQSANSSVKDSKYLSNESFPSASYKTKDLILGSGLHPQGLTISPSTLVNVPVSKSTSYRKPIQNPGILCKTSGNIDESVHTMSSSASDCKTFSSPLMSKVEHKSVISSAQRHGNSDSTVSSHGDSLSIFSQRSKAKDLQIIPMTSGENPLSIHPLPSNYKQCVNYSTDSTTRQDEKLETDIDYSPPVKKMKDSLSIVEVPRIVSPSKRQFDVNRKEDLKTPLEADVEVITLE